MKWKIKIFSYEEKDIVLIIAMLVFFGVVYFLLNNTQRQIDNHLNVTQGKIIEYYSRGIIKYSYAIDKYYESYAKIPSSAEFKASIFFDKNYLIEFSRVDPSNSRIIIDGVRYKSGVD